MAKTVFVDGDKSQGIPGTRVLAAWLNKVFGSGGHRHDGKDEDGSAPLDYAVDTGVANAYVIALDSALTAQVAGMPIKFKAISDNTGPSTLKVDDLAPVAIKKNYNQDLVPGDIKAGQVITVSFDGANYQMESHLANPFPVGMVSPYAGAAAPAGWLLCDGTAVSRTTYASLFAAIGTTYGAGDGATTFNIPDMRGLLPLGKDNMGGTSANRVTDPIADTLGGAAGAESHTLTSNEIPSHGHAVNDPGHYHTIVGDNAGGNNTGKPAPGNWSGGVNYVSDTKTTGITLNPTGGGAAHNNMSPYRTLNYIVKY